MMRSLFSGVAGLKTHQTRMDVIGNNIANVNTVGYKSSNVTFQELMYQTTQSASGANQATGRAGINAKQIGLGVQTGAINTSVTTAGASQSTGNPFDVQITGDSFFVVSNGSSNFFTRAGAFYVDGAGNLAMTSNGYTVQGWLADDLGEIQKDNVKPLQVMSADKLTAEPEITRDAYISGIIDKFDEDLTKDGVLVNTSIYDNLGYSYIAQYSITSTGDDGIYKMTLSDVLNSDGTSVKKLEDPDSTTDPKELYGTVDKWGVTINQNSTDDPNSVYLKYDKVSGKFLGFWDGASAPAGYGDANNFNEVTEDTDPKVRLLFDTAKRPEFKADEEVDNDHPADTLSLSLKTTTMFDNNETSTVAGQAGDYSGHFAGRKVGTMSGLSIDTSGVITASYTNGEERKIGQIAVASFNNPSGLEKVGENLYQSTQNSGTFDGIGMDITSDGGSMATGVLEMSNVDLSAEFTDMITTQRGFQANSRIITVSDSMLEELTNLKR